MKPTFRVGSSSNKEGKKKDSPKRDFLFIVMPLHNIWAVVTFCWSENLPRSCFFTICKILIRKNQDWQRYPHFEVALVIYNVKYESASHYCSIKNQEKVNFVSVVKKLSAKKSVSLISLSLESRKYHIILTSIFRIKDILYI